VKGFTARIFWEGGLKSIGAVAESDIEDIVPLLVKVLSVLNFLKVGAFVVPKKENERCGC